MGPAARQPAMSSPYNPPVFVATQDVFNWRRSVARWVDLVQSAAEKGTDKMYKTVFATLCRQLYDRGLPSAQQSIVDEAQEKGKINYKQDDQVRAVREIVDLIAIDPPIAKVTRMISSFHKVSSCRRRKQEELTTFVSRFHGLASEHLHHTGASFSSQIGEFLAITLLNNADLPESTLNNAVLQLLNCAESRAKRPGENPTGVSVHDDVLTAIRSCSRDLHATTGTLRAPQTVPELTKLLVTSRSKVRRISDRLRDSINKLPTQTISSDVDPLSGIASSSKDRAVIHLEDAISVLRSLSISTKSASSQITRNEVESIFSQKLEKALLSLGGAAAPENSSSAPPNNARNNKKRKRRNQSQQNSNGDNKRQRSQPSSRRVSATNCHDCGSKTHLRGSEECPDPNWQTRKRRMEADLKAEKEKEKQKDTFFRPGSSSTKGNLA